MNLINACFILLVVVGLLDFNLVSAQRHRGGKMTKRFINSIIKLHNEYRRGEGASNMKQLKWSPQLQRDAQIWANKCRYAHAYGKWGENLFKVESHLPDDVLIERAINEWYFEKMSWAFTPDCSEACHYTQVVWAKSEEIGCAFKRCPTLFLTEEFIPNGWMLVCYYSTQGNIIGQMPYTHGKPCSACDKGYTCNRGLCNRPSLVRSYLPPRPKPPTPKPRPTPRVYRAAANPVPPNPAPQNPHRQNQQGQQYRPQHATKPNNVVISQSPPAYQAPPPQQRKHEYRHPAPQNPPFYQQPVSPHKPGRRHPPGQVKQPHVQPRVASNQPGAQPANYRTVKPHYKHHTHRVWRGHEQIYQGPPKQQPVQQTSKIQYISGKILTGWIPVKTTKPPSVVHTNQTRHYPQLSASGAPASSYQQVIRSQPAPVRQQQQHVQYPVQQAQPTRQGHSSRPAAYNPQPQSVQYQQQYPPQIQAQQGQPKPTHNQHQYPAQTQNPQQKQPLLTRPASAQYQQQPVRPASARNTQTQYPAKTAPIHRRQPHNEYTASAPDTYRNRPKQDPYYQNPSRTPQYANSASNRLPITQPQASSLPGHQPYIQRQGQGPNQQFYPEPVPVQTGTLYVDPRPIYVPPAPTALPPQPTTIPPPPPPCHDADKNCQHWGVYCKSNPYVHDNCRVTCNTCTVPTPPPVPIKNIQTTARPTTTPQPSIIPSNPPSPITPKNEHHREPPKQQRRQTRQPPVKYNNYVTTTAAFYPQTTGYNNRNQHYAPTTPATYHMGPPGGGPGFGPCRNYDNRCKQWAKYCGVDEYVDDMCRLTCMLCHKI